MDGMAHASLILTKHIPLGLKLGVNVVVGVPLGVQLEVLLHVGLGLVLAVALGVPLGEPLGVALGVPASARITYRECVLNAAFICERNANPLNNGQWGSLIR